MGEIEVEFAGEERVVTDRLTFGRAGELELDTNRHLHRLVGEFVRLDGRWWLRNLGSRLFVTLVGGDGTRADVAPGAGQVLGPPGGSVLVVAGQARYELVYRLEGVADATVVPEVGDAGATVDFSAQLTPREVDVLVTFARQVLDGTNGPLPTYVDVAATWELATKTVDNTVQSIKRKLRGAGMAREEPLDAMVRIAIAHSLIGHADLEWSQLTTNGPPRSALHGPRFAVFDRDD